jgi:hypothetical protein
MFHRKNLRCIALFGRDRPAALAMGKRHAPCKHTKRFKGRSFAGVREGHGSPAAKAVFSLATRPEVRIRHTDAAAT